MRRVSSCSLPESISESSWSLKKYYLVSRVFLRGRFLPGPLFRSWFLWCTGPKSLAPGESSLGGKGLGVKQTHTCSAAVSVWEDSSYQLQLMWTDTHLFSCCVRPQRLLISTTAHVNGHTLVQLLCTATETPNINYSSCERTHTCSAAVYGHRDSSYQLQLMWTDTHLFSCCVRPQRLLISTTAHVNGHTLVQLLCTATETPNINYSSCERTHTRSAAVYGHRDS